ncbi:MAG: hypothetical protein FIB05_10685 [Betaproteobacteria bacterium]|nr:hypothetical protein [Betaproteobacteria bacterium]PWB60992.1 MAG: hypothetical protein C3F16_09370 [Betaproteobacteria bacterium]
MKRLAWIALSLLWAVTASAESQFGVTVDPGAKADAAVTRDLKEMAVDKESAAFMSGPVMVTIQNPWMDMATGRMMKDTLISIVRN